jgi:hypothetical protein
LAPSLEKGPSEIPTADFPDDPTDDVLSIVSMVSGTGDAPTTGAGAAIIFLDDYLHRRMHPALATAPAPMRMTPLLFVVTIVLPRMEGALVHQEYQEENSKSKTGKCNRAHCLSKRFKTQLQLLYRCDDVVE